MANRSVVVRLEAEVAGYVAGFGKAAQATEDVTKKTAQAKKSIGDNHQAMQEAGAAYTVFGAASVAALGASAKAAMDWESAWAGVTKTVDGSPEQMAALEEELRSLAKTMPATHEEIAGVAEAAGQLGVAREDVTSFTKTMIDLAETTNLSADAAATSIAQFMNVMGTAGDDVGRLGATLVALGNDGASTEAEIMDMAQRLSGAGKLIGASEGEVLALANALASVGVEAQLGGGVMSRVMQRMYGDVMEGGEGLAALADVAGVSSKEFATAFENDPIRATDMMVKGLNGVKESGGNVMQTMADLGIKGTEETSVLLRLAGAGDLVTDSLDLQAEAWESNTALLEEANKRYETTEAKVQIAWNNIKDAAIDAGAVLLPVIQGVAETVSGLASTFGSLPEPVQGAITMVAGITGGAALLGGGLLTLIPKIADTRQAFRDLNAVGSRIPGTLGKIAKGAAAAGAIAAVGVTIAKIAEASYMDDIDTGMGRVADSLARAGKEGPGAAAALDELFTDRTGGDLIRNVDDLDSALSRTFNKSWDRSFNDWAEGIAHDMTGIEGSSQILEGTWQRLDQGLADLVSGGNAEQAEANFQRIKDAAEEQGIPVESLVALFPQYADALRGAAAEGGNAAGGQEALDQALQDTGVTLDGVIDDMDKFLEQLFSAGLLTMSSRDANAEYHEALRGVDEALKTINESGGEMGAMLNKNRSDFELSTEAGKLANEAFQEIAQSGMAEVEAMAKEGLGQDELQEKLSQTYDDLVANAEAMGIDAEHADDLARKVLGIPDGVDIDTWMSDQAKRTAQETKTAIEEIPAYKRIDIEIYQTQYDNINEMNKTPEKYGGRVAHGPGGSGGLGYATGGAVYGPGTATSDSVPANLSNGEHVLTAAEVQAMGGHGAVYRFRNHLRGSGVASFADGGAVGSMAASAQQAVMSGGGGTRIDLGGITINGATDANAVRRAVVDEIQWKFQKNGVRLG